MWYKYTIILKKCWSILKCSYWDIWTKPGSYWGSQSNIETYFENQSYIFLHKKTSILIKFRFLSVQTITPEPILGPWVLSSAYISVHGKGRLSSDTVNFHVLYVYLYPSILSIWDLLHCLCLLYMYIHKYMRIVLILSLCRLTVFHMYLKRLCSERPAR